MKLRTKMLIGTLLFGLALAILGAWSARTLFQMSAVARRIISENYDSVVAAQEMKESLERQDSSALFDLLGEHARARRQAVEHRARFDTALATAAANITEPGEADVIAAIRRDRDDYYRRFDAFLGGSGDRASIYFQSLEPRFDGVRAESDRLLRLNQEAMRSKADRASAIARRWLAITFGLAAVLMAVGVGTVTLLQDVTHLSEVSQLKSEFIASASHELRTPLTTVQMGIHLLLEEPTGTLNDRQRQIAEVCRDDGDRLDQLMREPWKRGCGKRRDPSRRDCESRAADSPPSRSARRVLADPGRASPVRLSVERGTNTARRRSHRQGNLA